MSEIMPDQPSDSPDSSPKCVKQPLTLFDLTRATLDSIKLYRTQKDKIIPIGALTLAGMKAAFPQKLSNQNLHYHPHLRFFNCISWLGVELNDAVDIIPTARAQKQQPVVETIFHNWKQALRASTSEAKISASETHRRKQLLRSYQREILFCEATARNTSPQEWSLTTVTNYREIMNAISLTHNAAALLADDLDPHRTQPIPKSNLTWQALEAKYAWMTQGQPQTSIETKLCGLYNLVMGSQVVDDFFDLPDDQRLGLCTFATQVFTQQPNPSLAQQQLDRIAADYFTAAQTFGVTTSAARGMKLVFSTLKSTLRKFPRHIGGRRERMLATGELILNQSSTQPKHHPRPLGH